ncbi:MAG: PorV/PorQ family protein [Endomicrobiales bacterium]|nr:PorV/PorQ family protein [Endomicrobiales bacterium]
MKKITGLIRQVLIIIALWVCFVNGVYSAPKTSSAQFLTLGSSARNAAMGQSGVTGAESSSDLYWNPAGLAEISNPNVSLMHAAWFADTSYQWASFALPVEEIGTIGFGVQFMNYGNINAYDTTGLKTGELSPNDMAISASYSTKVTNYIDIGASAKYISSTIKNTAATCAVDVGGIYWLDDYNLRAALTVRNIGGKLKYVSKEEPLPETITAGLCYEIMENLQVVSDINFPTNSDAYFGTGAEYTFNLNNEIKLDCRGGYNSLNSNTNGITNISTGFGLTYKAYRIDYAFLPFGDLGSANLLSLNIEF